ncbi:MAG: biotin/lipoate A/B protein ligase family protein [Candidatus Woesearchaeota archaeon]
MKTRIIPFRKESASFNLALEEALYLKAKEKLKQGEEVQPIVKMYGFKRPSVVLGHRQKISEINNEYCEDQGVEVTMRTTGGGSVFLGEEDIQYSVILNDLYSKKLLRSINSKLKDALLDNALPAKLKVKDNHPVVRVDNRGSLFDAQRRFKSILLHHGTTLVDDFDYEHMPASLKATKKELEVLKKGNLWLRNLRQVKARRLIKSYERNLVNDDSFVKKDYTGDELKLARKLYKEFYSKKDAFDKGLKSHGICYLTSTEYDMDLYYEEDKE